MLNASLILVLADSSTDRTYSMICLGLVALLIVTVVMVKVAILEPDADNIVISIVLCLALVIAPYFALLHVFEESHAEMIPSFKDYLLGVGALVTITGGIFGIVAIGLKLQREK